MNTIALNGWRECDLSELISEIESGQRPYGGVTEESGEIPSLGGENIRQDGGLALDVVKKVPTEFYRAMTKGVLRPHDVLINKDGANTGKTGIYGGEFPIATINEHLFLLRGKPDRLAQSFLYRILVSEHGQRTVRAKISGSAQPGLKSDFIRHFPVFVPNATVEQSRIAAVLDTVDAAIAKTEAVIAKLKQVRAGLLHDLLTRGLDENGQLRPPPAEAPHLYKDSPLGGVPREWRIVALREIAEVASGLTLGRSLDKAGTLELPYLRVANVQDGFLDLTDVKTIRIYPHELERFQLQPGDVLMNEGGDYDKLGRGTVWEGQISVCLHQNHVFRVRCLPGTLNCYFLAAVSGSMIGKRYFLRSSKQSTNLASINSTQLNAFEVPVPSLAEQEAIVRALRRHDTLVAGEANALAKFRYLKSGLMTDLLTGRVRVPETRDLTGARP